ncbi:hypothetical protein GCM10022376_26870 [Yimella lutea]
MASVSAAWICCARVAPGTLLPTACAAEDDSLLLVLDVDVGATPELVLVLDEVVALLVPDVGAGLTLLS